MTLTMKKKKSSFLWTSPRWTKFKIWTDWARRTRRRCRKSRRRSSRSSQWRTIWTIRSIKRQWEKRKSEDERSSWFDRGFRKKLMKKRLKSKRRTKRFKTTKTGKRHSQLLKRGSTRKTQSIKSNLNKKWSFFLKSEKFQKLRTCV